MSSSGPLEQLTSQSGAYEIISKALADKNAAESALLDFFIDKVKEKDDIIDDRELEILRMYFVLDGLAKDWWVLQAPLSKLPSEHQRSTLRFSSLGQTAEYVAAQADLVDKITANRERRMENDCMN
uniref:Uncharacterized protein n=1 Tax=Schizophyllum commune (strain H4-8 / FGSC 9210) TaxID=578458 RepID=D8PY67_SCHCM